MSALVISGICSVKFFTKKRSSKLAVLNKFDNWQAKKPGAPFNAAAPNLVSLRKYLVEKYGGQNLGIYGNRPVTGGTSPSSHAFGAAMDWRYQNPGPGRAVCMNEIVPFLINNSAELGVQAIHDYFGAQVWRAGRGWLAQRPGSHGGSMGRSWATWLHIEVHPDFWSDGRSVMEKIGFKPVQNPEEVAFPPFDPRSGKFGLWPLAKNKPTIRIGARGDAVKYFQGVIFNKAGGGIVVDGNFGPQTDKRVKDLQAFFVKKTDGVVGPVTWQIIDFLAGK